jgi:ABC-type transport system substrate-binding protein
MADLVRYPLDDSLDDSLHNHSYDLPQNFTRMVVSSIIHFNPFTAVMACVLSLVFMSFHAHAATNPADPNKVIHFAFPGADDGFDMVRTANYYSAIVASSIQEPLLTYDYLARPAQLVPDTVEALPVVSDGGRVYVFHIRKGIYFAPDPAFKGVQRELTAQDYAYTFKRFLDPKNHSPSASFLDGKIVGMDAALTKAKQLGQFDYDTPIRGLEAPNRYTLKITLEKPDYNFLYVMAYSGFGAVAREVVDHYGAQISQHPVGTGPYMLQTYVPRSKIVLVANPNYRPFIWSFKPTEDAWDKQLVRDMQGKTMPQVGRIEISVIEEAQSSWLAFQGKQLDLMSIPSSFAPIALNGRVLKPDLAKQGILLNRSIEPEVTYTFLNYKDPVIGGNSLAKIALRRAIIMSYSTADELEIVRKKQAIKAEMMIPDGVVGHDANYRSSVGYDPDLANKLLDHFGYKRGADGYRMLPNGQPLLLKINTEANSTSQQMSEIWQHGLDKIGIHSTFPVSNFADNLKAATQCKLMMWGGAWIADYPEGENFMQLLYGPNSGQGNNGCYSSPAYDALYVKAKSLPPGEARNTLYVQMNRQVEADSVWLLGVSRVSNTMVRPWIKGFKRHPILASIWQYLDVEKH